MLDKQNVEHGLSHSAEATAVAPAPATSLLVIEDDENIATALAEYFSRAGYAVLRQELDLLDRTIVPLYRLTEDLTLAPTRCPGAGG